jgi:hypothetical protein
VFAINTEIRVGVLVCHERGRGLERHGVYVCGCAPAAAPAGDAKPAAAAAKTEFAVKLVKFDAAAKIKVRLCDLISRTKHALWCWCVPSLTARACHHRLALSRDAVFHTRVCDQYWRARCR